MHEEKGGEDVLLYARPSKCSITVMCMASLFFSLFLILQTAKLVVDFVSFRYFYGFLH